LTQLEQKLSLVLRKIEHVAFKINNIKIYIILKQYTVTLELETEGRYLQGGHIEQHTSKLETKKLSPICGILTG
jgi:alpha-D-ribose 1-methylphosphonate 5-triphosphate diphosphatase PhnM